MIPILKMAKSYQLHDPFGKISSHVRQCVVVCGWFAASDLLLRMMLGTLRTADLGGQHEAILYQPSSFLEGPNMLQIRCLSPAHHQKIHAVFVYFANSVLAHVHYTHVWCVWFVPRVACFLFYWRMSKITVTGTGDFEDMEEGIRPTVEQAWSRMRISHGRASPLGQLPVNLPAIWAGKNRKFGECLGAPSSAKKRYRISEPCIKAASLFSIKLVRWAIVFVCFSEIWLGHFWSWTSPPFASTVFLTQRITLDPVRPLWSVAQWPVRWTSLPWSSPPTRWISWGSCNRVGIQICENMWKRSSQKEVFDLSLCSI